MVSVNKLLGLIEPEAKAMVEHIEASPLTTKDHYGDYLGVLGRVEADHNHTTMMVFAFAMIKAGANKQGVQAALKIMGAL